jgi:hypothetical protein
MEEVKVVKVQMEGPADLGGEYRLLETNGYTGTVEIDGQDGLPPFYHYFVNGKLHRELGAAVMDRGREYTFWIEGECYDKGIYWEKMYQKYKGTADEALCVSKILGELSAP